MRTHTPLSQPGGGVSRQGGGRERWATSVTAPARRREVPPDHPAGLDVVFVIGPSSEGWPGTSLAPIGGLPRRARAAPRLLCRARGATGRSGDLERPVAPFSA